LVEKGLLALLSWLFPVSIADEELLERINQRIFKILNHLVLNCLLFLFFQLLLFTICAFPNEKPLYLHVFLKMTSFQVFTHFNFSLSHQYRHPYQHQLLYFHLHAPQQSNNYRKSLFFKLQFLPCEPQKFSLTSSEVVAHTLPLHHPLLSFNSLKNQQPFPKFSHQLSHHNLLHYYHIK
jgi:hypothetical protein